jgi:hypothetical protein
MTHYNTKDDPEVEKAVKFAEKHGVTLRHAMSFVKGGFKEDLPKPVTKSDAKKSHVK